MGLRRGSAKFGPLPLPTINREAHTGDWLVIRNGLAVCSGRDYCSACAVYELTCHTRGGRVALPGPDDDPRTMVLRVRNLATPHQTVSLTREAFTVSTHRTPCFPSTTQLARAIVRLSRALEFTEDDPIDIRLQVYPVDCGWALRCGWTLRYGDSSYAPDHRGYWGCSSLEARVSLKAAREIAADLIEQTRDDYASSLS